MRIKKSFPIFIALISLALIFLAILIVVPTPVSASPVTVSVDTGGADYIPVEPVGTRFNVDILIDASELTYNGPDGIIYWAIYVKTDPAVLMPKRVTTGVSGYFLYDFADYEWYDYPNKVSTINTTTGLVDVAEMFFAPLPAGGAATDGVLPTPYLLVTIGYEVMGPGSTLIDIQDPVYTALEAPETKISMEDVDGWYGAPGAQYSLTIAVPVHGTTDPVPGTYTYDEGSLVDVTAIPDDGWTLDYWDLDGSNVGDANPYTVTMNADYTLTAFFTEITVPTIKSCNSTGTEKNTFDLGEEVWVIGSHFESSILVDMYAVQDVLEWSDFDGMDISDLTIMDMNKDVETDANGNIPATPLWTSGLVPGKYDIVVDVNQNGVYDDGVDVLDDYEVETAGFFVIPEFWLGTILGLVACFAAFGVFYASKRKHLSDSYVS